MNSKTFIIWSLAVLAAPFLCGAAPADSGVLLGQLAAPVQKTIRATVGEGRLRSIDKNDENGDVSYDVEMVGRGGRSRSFTVGANGELLDKQVFMNELPVVVRQAIRKKAGTAVINDVDEGFDNGEPTFDVEITADGKTRNFTLDAKGKTVDEEVFLTELPDSLQAAIRKETAGATIDEITRSSDDDEPSYNVDILSNGKTRTLSFDADGALLSREEDVALAEVPAAAQKRIQSCTAGGKLITIQKITENGVVSFDADVRQEGKLKSYSVSANGELIDSDEND
jgi:uncharacterized membrane protein YkoI